MRTSGDAVRTVGVALAAAALPGSVLALVLASAHAVDARAAVWVVTASFLSGLASLWVVQTTFGRRLARFASAVEERARTKRREAVAVEDAELGRVLEAVDRLLTDVELAPERPRPDREREASESGEGDAVARPREDRREGRDSVRDTLRRRRDPSSMRITGGDAAQSQRELALATTLARKTDELEQRLRERALLFELLRESASSIHLDEMLARLVERLGPALDLRELAVLLRESSGAFAVHASWGFRDPQALVGRRIEPGEGLTSEAIQSARPVVVDDVANEAGYLAFWGEAHRSGSFMSVPIRMRDEVIGAIALTRPPGDPLTELESRFLLALADQIALSIHNAQLFKRLEELSTLDELTHLPNRRLFKERLDREIAEARRYGHAASVLMIDVDHFKKLNDRWGHPIGDEALVTVGSTIRGALREVDTVARWGGEEFIVLLSRAGEREGLEVGEKLRCAVAAIERPWARAQPDGHLTVSVGVAELRTGEDGPGIIQRADRAVYVAKREGRNRVTA